MDILAHALYGATVFSRVGLAGFRRRPAAAPLSFTRDWTVWAAAGFALAPDLSSIGLTFARMLLRGDAISFHNLPPSLFVLYHCTHSLAIAGLVLFVLWVFARPVVVPALAWPLHILMDSFSHGDGPWQTLMFYPLSGWHYHGFNWWQTPGLMLLYWSLLPVLWLGLALWHHRWKSRG